MTDLEDYRQPLLELCASAGEEIAAIYRSPEAVAVERKDDNSPITIADQRSNSILLAGLTEFGDGYPILSEESNMPEWRERAQWQRYWLVDPLDGTREFVSRTGDFTINIALVSNHQPVLGMIYLPLERVAYFGVPGWGALRLEGGESFSLEPRVADVESELIATNRRHRGEAMDSCLGRLGEVFSQVSRQYVGSALKFCHLSEGRADIYPRFSPCSEWDTAAGQALLEAVGGQVVDMQFRPLHYNSRASTINPYFYAMADAEFPWQAVLTAEY